MYSLEKLVEDVMGRLGEVGGTVDGMPSVPSPGEVLAIKVESLLPEVGARILMDAPVEKLGCGVPIECEITTRRMPCGMYAAEVTLPGNFVRLVSARMAGWKRSVGRLILPDSAGWECQWSAEAGIAGSPERPRGYLEAGCLRLIGSEDVPVLEHLCGWMLPEPPAFSFPAVLYPDLVAAISAKVF